MENTYYNNFTASVTMLGICYYYGTNIVFFYYGNIGVQIYFIYLRPALIESLVSGTLSLLFGVLC